MISVNHNIAGQKILVKPLFHVFTKFYNRSGFSATGCRTTA